MFLMVPGLILFGISNLRKLVLPRWQWLPPLASGAMGFIGFFLFSGEEITAIFLIFRTLFALSARYIAMRSIEYTPEALLRY